MRILFLYSLAALMLAAPYSALGQQQPEAARAAETTAPSAQHAVLLKEAFAHEDAGDLKAAIATYERILAIDPGDVRAMNTIAGLNGKLGNFEAEVSWAAKAISANPEFHPAYLNQGNALMQLGRADEARASFEKAVQLEPRDPIGYYSLGVLAEQERDLPAAVGFYRKATEVEPRFEAAHFNLAAAHANLGQFDEAIAALDTVLELNPGAEDAKAMRAAIERDPRRRSK